MGHEKFIQNFDEKHEGKRLHGRPRRRWKDNITMDLRKYGGKVWIRFIWLRIRTSGRLL
jgi:hypothetical protein